MLAWQRREVRGRKVAAIARTPARVRGRGGARVRARASKGQGYG